MGNSERSNDPPADLAIDGWFDLLDDESDRAGASQRPTPKVGRPSNGANLSALNEISNKVTPVMLAPVHHLLPAIEPSQPAIAIEPRDVWETDDESDLHSFFSVPPANAAPSRDGAERKSDPDPLPPLMEMSDADGEEFLDFGDGANAYAPVGGNLHALSRRESQPPAALGSLLASTSSQTESDLAEGPEVEFEPTPSRPPLPIAPPSARMHDPADVPTSTPLPATLLGPLPVPPQQRSPAALPQAIVEEDAFDLSDFDRWGRDDEVTPSTGIRSPIPKTPSFASPPAAIDFSEDLTIPRMNDGRPIVQHEAVRARQDPPPAPAPAPTPAPAARKEPTTLRPPGRLAAKTMNWSTDAPPVDLSRVPNQAPATPAPASWRVPPPPTPAGRRPTPTLAQAANEMPTPVRPPPLPSAQALPTPPPPRPMPVVAVTAPVPVPPPAPPPKLTPQQEMHERFDLGDFAGALGIAEAILEVDPGDDDPTHVAEVCRAKLRAIYIGRLGALDRVPVIAVASAEIRWLALDHRAGFIVSLVDGMSTLEDIVDISGMPQLEALRTLYNLITQQIITLRAR